MGGVALLALAIDVATALLLWAMAKGSLNVRAAFVLNITDALGSLGVLIGAGLVLWLGWDWVDPLLTLLIAGSVLWQVVTMLPKAVSILMEGTPPDMNLDEGRRAMCAVEGVANMHHLHVWHHDDKTLFRITKLGVAKVIGDSTYKTAMPIYADTLSDLQIIAVLCWIKAQWPPEVRKNNDLVNTDQN